MANFYGALQRANALTGVHERKIYNEADEPPSDAEVAKAIVGIQGEVSDILAWQMEIHRQLVTISRGVWFVPIAILGAAAASFVFPI